MQYSRSPLKQKHNQFQQFKNPFQYNCSKEINNPFYKQQSAIKRNYKQIKFNDHRKGDQYLIGANSIYTKSQMIYQPQNYYQEKIKNQCIRTTRNQNPSYLYTNKTNTCTQQRKFNAKQSEIQSKINKIQNYQNKIESLLQFMKTTTPKKHNEISASKNLSKQTSRFGTPVSSNRYKRRQTRNDKSEYVNRYGGQQKNDSSKKNQNLPKPFQIEHYGRKNRYFINQPKIQQQIRNKSRQFMKAVQGQVKQIKNTVYELNQKIKKVDMLQLPFRKQIVFDLSSSNPESKSSEIDPYENHYQLEKKINNQKQRQRQRSHMGRNIYKQKVFNDNKQSEFALNRQKSKSKLQQYKMRKRERQNEQFINSTDINSCKKSGYIYNYKQ